LGKRRKYPKTWTNGVGAHEQEFMKIFSQGSMMQEHRKQASKASAKVEDNWNYTSAPFEDILNLNEETLMS
jgi:hypothetical protein